MHAETHKAAKQAVRDSTSARFSAKLGLWAAAAGSAFARLATHRVRTPCQRSQSPMAEVAFGAVLFGTLREIVRNYFKQANSFQLRDELFQEMAVARTYSNSIIPWVQTLSVVIVASFGIVWGVKALIKSMKEWEEQQELKEMQNYGEDSAWFLNTTITATPVERASRDKRKKGFFLFRLFGGVADKLWMLRVAACVGYLLPLLNILDFGEISISLYPYPMGVPFTEPPVNFLENTLGLKYLYKAYIKSGYYFLLVWFLFIQVAVRNKSAPRFVRFHSSQAILMSMLLGVPQQVFFAVLNPWESGLLVQNIMYHSMVTLFYFTLLLIGYCCIKALMKKEMKLPLVSEAAVMWAGKE